VAERTTHRLLVLDDDPIGRALVVSVLEEDGHSASGTEDAGAAAEWVRGEPSGVLLADLLLGVLEPVPLVERAREQAPGDVAPPDGYAILVHERPNLPRAGLRSGNGQTLVLAVLGYVKKPVNPERLLDQIGALPVRAVRAEALETALPELPLVAPEEETEFLVPELGQGEPKPRAPEEPPARPSHPPPSSRPRGISPPAFEALPKALRTALIVDDDENYRLFLRGLLEPAGFTLFEAKDGEAALRLALARRPWLILSEVNLPHLDGFEFCRRVRSHSLLRHTPLVFLSAWDEYRERYHGLSLGADDYLSKRTDARELLIRLQIILKRYAEVGARGRKGAAMEGGIELIGAPGMLQMCHIGRFTGVLTVRSGAGRVQIRLKDGEILSAESNMAAGAEAIFEFLAWSRGHFEFIPGDPGEGEVLREKFDYLLLEGCRRLDERQRALDLHGEESPGS
jgi:DNA-binding response OmpR family regulator